VRDVVDVNTLYCDFSPARSDCQFVTAVWRGIPAPIDFEKVIDTLDTFVATMEEDWFGSKGP
jgi:hypothetical protein